MCKRGLSGWKRKAAGLKLVTNGVKMPVPLRLKLAGLSFPDQVPVSPWHAVWGCTSSEATPELLWGLETRSVGTGGGSGRQRRVSSGCPCKETYLFNPITIKYWIKPRGCKLFLKDFLLRWEPDKHLGSFWGPSLGKRWQRSFNYLEGKYERRLLDLSIPGSCFPKVVWGMWTQWISLSVLKL